jgi:SpoVK/Ycf46/Vps4 family AAA+-type ATPase
MAQADLGSLVDLLKWLDVRLESAVAIAQSLVETEGEQNPYRGIQIDEAEVAKLLAQAPGQPLFTQPELSKIDLSFEHGLEERSLSWLVKTFTLTTFDLGIIAIALAPELDRRYERIYLYLQDDVRAKRPTVDLSLNVLCGSTIEKLERRSHFAPDAPLIQQGLLHLIPDPNQAEPSLLAHIIKLDPSVVRLLLGESGLDPRLKTFCGFNPLEAVQNYAITHRTSIPQSLLDFVQAAQVAQDALTLFFHGVDQVSKQQTASAIAQALRTPLLTATLSKIGTSKVNEFIEIIKLLLRDAQFQNALLYIDQLDDLQNKENRVLYQVFTEEINTYSGIVILSGTENHKNAEINLHGVIEIAFPVPSFEQRRAYWHYQLKTVDIHVDDLELDRLSDRFRLTPRQIENAVLTAVNQAQWQHYHPAVSLDSSPPSIEQLFMAARRVSGHELKTLSQQIQPTYCWDDIVLSLPQKTQLREICNHIQYHHLVWETWGFKAQRSLGRGLNVMFAGASGTGKTMAAEVIAKELELDLYKIDLSQMVSKYIGETEKNLNQIFTAATNANAILLFDEADALFGKRSSVKDAHDRYANLEVSYLLQKIEEYEGLAILTTNLRGNMDDAFMRRLQFIIEFQLPNEKQRHQIWQKVFPHQTPQEPDLGLQFLAHHFELTGANIRNIALMSAFLAAATQEKVGKQHIIQALRREYQKMGKIFMDQVEESYLN